MTPWTGWERRENHASSALLLSLPKLDVSYRKAQANKLELNTLVQIQVSSTWFCACLYGNDLASISTFCNVAKSVEVGSEFGPAWSIASQFYYIVLETQSWTYGLVPSHWFWDVGPWGTQSSSHPVRTSHRIGPTKGVLDSPYFIALFNSSKWNPQDRMGLLLHCHAGNSMKTSKPSKEPSFQCSDLTLPENTGWTENLGSKPGYEPWLRSTDISPISLLGVR